MMKHNSLKTATIITLKKTEFTTELQEEMRSAGFSVELSVVPKILPEPMPQLSDQALVCFECSATHITALDKRVMTTLSGMVVIANERMPNKEYLLVLPSHYSARPRKEIYAEVWKQ